MILLSTSGYILIILSVLWFSDNIMYLVQSAHNLYFKILERNQQMWAGPALITMYQCVN